MKKKTGFIISLFLFLVLIKSVYASSYEVTFYQYSNKLFEKHGIILDSEQDLIISLPSQFASFESKNPYNISDNKLIIKGQKIYFSFVNLIAIEKGERYYLTKKIEAPTEIDDLKVELTFDEGYVIDENYPYAETETDGRKIVAKWEFKNLQKGESVPVFVIFRNVKSSSLFWLIFVLILIFLAVLLWLKSRKKIVKEKVKKAEPKPKTPASAIGKYLLENEKKVLQELENEPRKELWQKQIRLRTGLSKVKLSRILRNLEARGLITKINFGKTNKIVLKE